MQNTRNSQRNIARPQMRKTNNYRIEHSKNNSDPKFIRFLKSLNWMRIILVVTAVYAVLSVSLRFITISQQKQKRNELMAKKESIMEEIESLENEKEYVGSDEYVEKVAREKLGWAKDDELVFKKKDE
ncbi:MAG: septum formation initiator family protein [Clostridia bacterium]|nr:septum formation initiator family protein [Clostridia bacterium]